MYTVNVRGRKSHVERATLSSIILSSSDDWKIAKFDMNPKHPLTHSIILSSLLRFSSLFCYTDNLSIYLIAIVQCISLLFRRSSLCYEKQGCGRRRSPKTSRNNYGYVTDFPDTFLNLVSVMIPIP